MTILITGGAGFIGSHLVRHLVAKYPEYHIHNLDALTYAGNLASLRDLENKENYTFHHVDLTNKESLESVLKMVNPDKVIHAAAESHVDRSILSPDQFAVTNVIGTLNLLNACKNLWAEDTENKLFYHISTDEVYGSLGDDGYFTEETAYDPRSPYSASKASSDHFVRAYFHTFGLPVIVSNCSNNYGPYQFPEKLIPLFIQNIIEEKPLPVYGDGRNIRDWLYVQDHIEAIDLILHKGKVGETYNIGGHNEWSNIDLVKLLCKITEKKLGRNPGSAEQLITYVKDRPGHDRRYAIDSTKLQKESGWKPDTDLPNGLDLTVDWYLDNQEWVNGVKSGEYLTYYQNNYQTKFNSAG